MPARNPEQQANFDLLIRLTEAIEQRVAAVGYRGLTEAEKTIYVVWWLEAEVNNGGFDQYFFNTVGDQVMDAAPALERVGAPRTAELVGQAIGVFPAPGPNRDRMVRYQQLEALPNRWSAFERLDDQFFEYRENLERLLAEYARANTANLPKFDPK